MDSLEILIGSAGLFYNLVLHGIAHDGAEDGLDLFFDLVRLGLIRVALGSEGA